MIITDRASDVRINERVNLGSLLQNTPSSTALLPVISAQGSSAPRYFTNAADFLFHYGSPDPAVSATIQSGLNFFTEGNSLWAVRVVGASAKYSGLVLASTAGGAVSFTPTAIENPSDVAGLVAGKETVLAFIPARGVGSHGNTLKVAITADGSTVTPIASVTAAAATTSGSLSEGSYKYFVSPILSNGEAQATEVSFTGTSGFSGAVTLTWASVPNAIGYYVYGRSGNTGRIALVGIGSGGTVTYTDFGTTPVNTGVEPITALSATFQDRPFTVEVYDSTVSAATPVESWTATLRPFMENGVQLSIEERINTASKYIRVISNAFALDKLPMITTQPATALAGGSSGTAPTSDDVVAALEPFASRQQYNVNLIINGGLADPIVQRAMDNLAKYRGDAVALLDIPSGYQEWNKAVDYRNLLLGICSDYSALFAPDLLHTVNGMQVYSPMSGFAAALCARTDRVATPGHSPAGVNRGRLNVLGARHQYTDPQCDALFKAHVNFTKTLSAVGTVLWEQQLLDGNVRWLSVRRVLNVIKTSVHSYLLYALQEMNTETVRRELTNAVNSYLERAVNSQAISAGVMICDGRNNNHSTALAGVLVATVRIIPIIPIHEIVLNIEVSQGGVAFSEQIGYTPTGTSNTTTEFSSRNTSLPGGSSSTTTQFSSGTSLPGGSSSITTEFSSRNSALPSGSSSTTIEYSSGTYLPGGTSNTTTEYSSTRPF